MKKTASLIIVLLVTALSTIGVFQICNIVITFRSFNYCLAEFNALCTTTHSELVYLNDQNNDLSESQMEKRRKELDSILEAENLIKITLMRLHETLRSKIDQADTKGFKEQCALIPDIVSQIKRV